MIFSKQFKTVSKFQNSEFNQKSKKQRVHKSPDVEVHNLDLRRESKTPLLSRDGKYNYCRYDLEVLGDRKPSKYGANLTQTK